MPSSCSIQQIRPSFSNVNTTPIPPIRPAWAVIIRMWQIIMAHLTACGLRGVMEIADVPNVWIDTSAYLPFAGLVEYAVEKLGAERVLYGSDLVIRDLPAQIRSCGGCNDLRRSEGGYFLWKCRTTAIIE